jgi:ABC-type multidrug transport system permease subunit
MTAMIGTRIMELRHRRGLRIAAIVVNIGLPALFLGIRLILHVFATRTSPPAGGYQIYLILAAGFLPTFGFIVATMVGCTAGSRDRTEGMFRHLVVTGRSRVALYLARIPAGLAIIVPLIAVGYAIVCAVCVFAAPTFVDDWNLNVPPGLSQAGFESFARTHARLTMCDLYNGQLPRGINCDGTAAVSKSSVPPARPAPAAVEVLAAGVAKRHYLAYARMPLAPSGSLMIYSGVWLELEAVVAFVLGLGLASLMGQRTGPVILLLAGQFILTPILSAVQLPHLQNLPRSVIGLAMTRLEPSGLPAVFGGVPGVTGGVGGPGSSAAQHQLGTTTQALVVVVAWVAVATIAGAWRMATRDA